MQSGYYVNNNYSRNESGANNYIYNKGKRYYSSLEAKIWFGSILVDEIVDFTYAVQQNSMPLFGYNSYTYDEMSVGSRIVNGAFVINFTEEHFVLKAMNELKNLSREQAIILKEQGSIFIDEDSQFTSDNVPLWAEQFKITVEYGNSIDAGQEVRPPSGITLTGVQITSVTTQNDIEGRPIMETYNFVAQDIVYHGDNSFEGVGSPNRGYDEEDLNKESVADVSVQNAYIESVGPDYMNEGRIVISIDIQGNATDIALKLSTKNQFFTMKRISENRWESVKTITRPESDMNASVDINFLDANNRRMHSKNENINISNKIVF